MQSISEKWTSIFAKVGFKCIDFLPSKPEVIFPYSHLRCEPDWHLVHFQFIQAISNQFCPNPMPLKGWKDHERVED